jgi:hypothetical protein
MSMITNIPLAHLKAYCPKCDSGNWIHVEDEAWDWWNERAIELCYNECADCGEIFDFV